MNRIIIFLFACLCAFTSQAQVSAYIARVKDGDTFVAYWQNKRYDCRLEHIDAPELCQSFGAEAKAYLERLLQYETVTLSPGKTDLYGRTLVSVTLKGLRLDSLLIRNGCAWHYINYSKDPVLGQAMKDASKQMLGLWSCGINAVCPPWLYRKYDARNKTVYCKGCN